MAVSNSSLPCPRCGQPLTIPRPQPAKVQCPRCQVVLRLAPEKDIASGISQPRDIAATKPARNIFSLTPAPNTRISNRSGDDRSLPRRRRSFLGSLLVLAVSLVVAVIAIGFWLAHANKVSAPVVSEPTGGTIIPAAKLDPRRGAEIGPARVDAAVEKGVSYLKKEILAAGQLYHRSELADVAPANAHLGATALAGLTLLECGVPPEDPAVQSAAQTIRESAPLIQATYTLATAILFLDHLHADAPADASARQTLVNRARQTHRDSDHDLIRSFALRLMAGQDQGGFWGYGRKGRPITKDEEENAFKEANAGRTAQAKLGYANLSNSQFAALGLWAARRHGVPVRPALAAVAKAAREKQNAEGTWNYDQNLPMKHSSACAGLIFLALEHGLAEDDAPSARRSKDSAKSGDGLLADPAVRKGMNFLGKFLAKPPSLSAKQKEDRRRTAGQIKEYYEQYENTKGQRVPPVAWTMDFAFSGTIFGADSWGDLYLLWSIERVGVIYGVEQIPPGRVGTDWYRWGAEIILADQRPGGQWEDRFPGVPDTCFALLFLKRANIAKDLTDKLRELLNAGMAGAPEGAKTRLPRKEN